MVMQSEAIGFITGKLTTGVTFTFATGESTTVDYQDNDLTTTHFTITDINTDVTDNRIQQDAILNAGEGNGNDYDSYLISADGEAFNKVKFTSTTKTDVVILRFRNTTIVYVE